MISSVRWVVVPVGSTSADPTTVHVAITRRAGNGRAQSFTLEFTREQATRLGVALIRGNGRCEPASEEDPG